MNEADQWMRDELLLEHEAVEALQRVKAAGLVAEADLLALVSGLSSRMKEPVARNVSHIEFP